MPDPILILKGMSAAAILAAAILLVISFSQRPHPARLTLGWVLGVAAGFGAGCWVLGLVPHWPPAEDRDRFLGLVLPAVCLVEALAAFPQVPSWLAWSLRTLVSIGVGRVLLHGSVYLTDLAGPGTRQWTVGWSWVVLGGIGLGLLGVWGSLGTLARRRTGRFVPAALAMACAAAGVAVMLSGYATGGQLGLPLAAALGGATLASPLSRRSEAATAQPGVSPVAFGAAVGPGSVGVGLVCLVSLLVVGRFFAELTTLHCLLLGTAPLWLVVVEVPLAARLPRWGAACVRLILVSIPLALVLVQAQRTFAERSAEAAPSAGSSEPSLGDYMQLGR